MLIALFHDLLIVFTLYLIRYKSFNETCKFFFLDLYRFEIDR